MDGATRTTFLVSTDPNLIVLPDEWADRGQVPQYETEQDALDSIERDQHGEIGTKYVLKVTTDVVAVASRPWTLVHKEGN